ncbi:Uncharacterised protein [Shigella sonnei]|nr:Uncharacterised protein [Shigella sonnei]
MSKGNRSRQIRATASNVRHLTQRQNPTTGSNQFWQQIDIRQSLRIKRQFHHFGSSLLGDHQPGDEVSVVFCHADNNLIARLQTRTRIALCHHVDGFSGAARPDDSFIIRCIQ